MKKLTPVKKITIGFATLLIVAAAVAGPSTRKTQITFSQSVRVPGTTLNAGTYYFDAPSFTNRTLVRITDETGNLVTQVMGLPEHIQKPNHDVITFGSHECGPKAIKLWFYAPSGTAVRFVYPKEEAASIAASCKEPVPEMHEKAAPVSQLEESKVYLATPKGKEEPYKPELLSTSDQMDQNGFDAKPEH